ncbi:MAG: hypothetical protein ACLQBX_02190 [Candidatus Limnocylindrales bacterium]
MSDPQFDPALAGLAHGDAAIQAIQAALVRLALLPRVEWLATHMLTAPIIHAVAQARVGGSVDEFNVLQGDIIRTDAAYRLGVRIEGAPTYMIATSSCDLVPGRRATALLLPLEPRRKADFTSNRQFTAELDNLTLYRPKKYFYVPVLPDDDAGVVYNVAWLDPLAVASNDAVNLAQRRASLSRVGWRIFGALVRELLVREAEDEDIIRDTFARPPSEAIADTPAPLSRPASTAIERRGLRS